MNGLMFVIVFGVSLCATQGLPYGEEKEKKVEREEEYNGTNWCGTDNIAETYQDFGEHKQEDKCCRSHAHCPYNIGGFSKDYGLFNYRFYTIFDCRCHEIFHDCLQDLNTTISDVVGNHYFNVIGFKCFRYQPQEACKTRAWYGGCEEYETIMTAFVDDTPISYEYDEIETSV